MSACFDDYDEDNEHPRDVPGMGKVRNDHPETAWEAAYSIAPFKSETQRRVFETIMRHGSYGLTDEETQEILDMNPSTERPRRIELVEVKRVVDSGMKRKTHSGRNAIVWVAA